MGLKYKNGDFYYEVTNVERCKLQLHKRKSKFTLKGVTKALPPSGIYHKDNTVIFLKV